MSPNRISLDARINIVLNGPGGETPPTGYEDYSNYAQYGGAAYMSIPPQPMPDPNATSGGYYQNPYVSMLPPPPNSEGPHHLPLPPPQHMQAHHSPIPPHLQQHHSAGHPSTYSNIPTINNSNVTHAPAPPHQYYYNDFNMGHQQMNPVLKELPKVSSVAVQKGNVLEIVPSNVPTTTTIGTSPSPNLPTSVPKSTAVEADTTVAVKKPKTAATSWKDEVNSRHVKAAVMRLNRESESSMRSILKRLSESGKTL